MRQDPETGSKRRPDRIDIIATAVLLIFTAALHLLYILITYMAFDRTNIAVGIATCRRGRSRPRGVRCRLRRRRSRFALR